MGNDVAVVIVEASGMDYLRLALEAAEAGKLAILVLHYYSVESALARLFNAPGLLLDLGTLQRIQRQLAAVTAQTLVPACGGRRAVFDAVFLDDQLRALITLGSPKRFVEAARSLGDEQVVWRDDQLFMLVCAEEIAVGTALRSALDSDGLERQLVGWSVEMKPKDAVTVVAETLRAGWHVCVEDVWDTRYAGLEAELAELGVALRLESSSEKTQVYSCDMAGLLTLTSAYVPFPGQVAEWSKRFGTRVPDLVAMPDGRTGRIKRLFRVRVENQRLVLTPFWEAGDRRSA
jgi:hypothetical protein